MTCLPRSFYARDSAIVARDLLGKILVRKLEKRLLKGRIVETEAYYGAKDPASRAFRKTKQKPGVAAQMFRQVGTTFVYMVHANWLFNVIGRSQKAEAGGVLVRALEPLQGIEEMKRRRKTEKITELCKGPGKLTKAFGITQADSGLDLTEPKKIWIETPKRKESFKIASSHRIGVTADLPRKLRFFIKENPYVSRPNFK